MRMSLLCSRASLVKFSMPASGNRWAMLVVMVPALTQWAGLSLKRAIATSLVCVGLFAVPGTITHAALGNIDWHYALFLSIAVIPGARVGSAFAVKATDARLRTSVGLFLALVAIAFGVGETIALVRS